MVTYGEIRRAVLELINQYTMAGELVALSYNNQMDYVIRIPNLINQAVMKIRTTVFPERRTAELIGGVRRGGWMEYPLPSDCRSLVTGGVWRLAPCGDNPMERTNRFRLMGKSILLPAPPESRTEGSIGLGDNTGNSGYFVEYLAYPAQLPAKPDDEYNMDETPEVLQAAEYYAAAQLVMMEDEYSHATLMNEYEARLAAMRPPITAEVHTVREVYGLM